MCSPSIWLRKHRRLSSQSCGLGAVQVSGCRAAGGGHQGVWRGPGRLCQGNVQGVHRGRDEAVRQAVSGGGHCHQHGPHPRCAQRHFNRMLKLKDKLKAHFFPLVDVEYLRNVRCFLGSQSKEFRNGQVIGQLKITKAESAKTYLQLHICSVNSGYFLVFFFFFNVSYNLVSCPVTCLCFHRLDCRQKGPDPDHQTDGGEHERRFGGGGLGRWGWRKHRDHGSWRAVCVQGRPGFL